MGEKVYNKLVRDKIPLVITESGQTPVYRTISGTHLKLNLLSKLYEEIQEFTDNPCEEEMADIMEVIQGMFNAWGFDTKSLLKVKDKKKEYLTDYYMTNEASAFQVGQLGFCEASGNWRMFDEINNKIDLVKTADLNKTFGKYMKTIDWTYLGKEDKVAKEDFKQLSPSNEKLPVSDLKKTKKQ